MNWKPVSEVSGETQEIVKRRFGARHEKPCITPSVLTCARYECQVRNKCMHDPIGMTPWEFEELKGKFKS